MKRTYKKSENAHYLKLLGIILVAIVFYIVLNNLGKVSGAISFVLGVFSPIIIGLAIAFILNLPLRFFEEKLFGKLTHKHGKIWSRIKRPLCLILSVLCILSVLLLILALVIPQFVEACTNFFKMLPEYMVGLEETIKSVVIKFNIPIDAPNIKIDWAVVSSKALELLSQNGSNITQSAIEVISAFFSGVINLILGFALSLYILASKEKLGRLAKSTIYAIMKRENARKLISVLIMSNKAFAGFISGQCIEVAVIGLLCFIGMLIFNFPFAFMVSCIVAITAFIPIFGPFIGTAIGAFLILLENPIKAIWFVIFIIILQQIESNVIYPRIMGKQVGLPGIWVLVAVTLGGGFFGIVGILVSVPICSVLYAMFDRWIKVKLTEKNICHASMSHDSSEPNEITVPYEIEHMESEEEKAETDASTDPLTDDTKGETDTVIDEANAEEANATVDLEADEKASKKKNN